MAWFILVRLVFFAGVTFAASTMTPIPGGLAPNAGFGAVLAAVAIVLEWSLRLASVAHILGALLGAAIGLLFAKRPSRRPSAGSCPPSRSCSWKRSST